MKARVMVTKKCNRNCKGCCNEQEGFLDIEKVSSVTDLLKYEEIIITGGEPMLIAEKVLHFVESLREEHCYSGKIYLYTALYNTYLHRFYDNLFRYIDGLHFSIHAEAGDQEIIELKEFSGLLPKSGRLSLRLIIDRRLYGRYDFSNIDFSKWSVVRKLKWQKVCRLPENEKLLIYEL
jgi:MoaA/NifB/PqqE/SkfB family radical SAM enzyme